MQRSIQLPVLDRLAVRNYPLYPGRNGRGLELDFKDGVTVLAGINGVGKTTLLNLLLRMIIGPADPKKVDRELGRVSKRSLTLPSKRDYFSLRVPDPLGDDATASLTFRIGPRTLVVTRYMRDMGLKSVIVDKAKHPFDGEIEFIEQLADWAGVASSYNFHILVRYLQFFAEDRLPILWSASTQFEFFKVLFFKEDLQDDLNATFADIQRIDTNYRNRRHQLNQREKSLPPLPITADVNIDTLKKMANEAEKAFHNADRDFEVASETYQNLRQRIFDADEALSRAEVHLTETEARFVAADAHFIAHALPTLDDKLRFLMQGLGGGQGCFVCGSRGKKQTHEIGKQLRQGKCFVCHSPLPEDQRSLSGITAAEVRAIEGALDEAHEEVEKARVRRDALEEEIEKDGLALRHASSRRRAALQQFHDLERSIPASPVTEGADERAWIEEERKQLAALVTERDRLVEQYREAVGNGQAAMASLTDSLRKTFTHYAEAFLREDVTVDISRQVPFKPATGAKQVNIPAFTVKMTSSTFKQPTARLSSDSVSESQKEFLDLAFRMAMLDLIAPSAGMAMVVETPEASLDAYFMRRAADLMRRFTQHAGVSSRRMVATSNLNGTTMIPALLGILREHDDEIVRIRPADAGHLVNLMEETARAKVLEEPEAADALKNAIARYAV